MEKKFSALLGIIGLFLPLLFAGCEKDPMVPVDPEPSIWVTVSQNTVPKGSSVTLEWGSNGLTSLSLNGTSVALEGELKIFIKKDTSFTFVGKTTNGTELLSEPKTVAVLGEIPAPTVVLKSTKSVSWNTPAQLTWLTNYGDSVRISPLPSTLNLPIPLNGNCKTDSLKESTTFRIIVYGKGGVAEDSTFIEVGAPPVEYEEEKTLNGNWKMTSWVHLSLDGDTLAELDLETCLSDDVYIFSIKEKTFKRDSGLWLCEGTSKPFIAVWNYVYDPDKHSITIGYARFLKKISVNEFVWEFSNPFGTGPDQIPAIMRQTFKKIK